MTAAGATPRYRPVSLGGSLAATFEQRADGSTLVGSAEPLLPYPQRLTDRLLHWAATAPGRTLAARREAGGDWRHLSYAQALATARSIAQKLIHLGLSEQRPLAILSDNDLEHLQLMLGAMLAGVPYASISPAYSLMSQDFGKLRHIVGMLTPGLVFASGANYARAIAAVVPPEVPVVLASGTLEGRQPGSTLLSFADLLATPAGAAVDAAHARVGPDTIVKFLFTSGSTKQPKGVINTQRHTSGNAVGSCIARSSAGARRSRRSPVASTGSPAACA